MQIEFNLYKRSYR